MLKYIQTKYFLLKYVDLTKKTLKNELFFARARRQRRFLKIFRRNAPPGAKFLRFPPSDGLRDTLKGPKFSPALELGGGGQDPPVPPPPLATPMVPDFSHKKAHKKGGAKHKQMVGNNYYIYLKLKSI